MTLSPQAQRILDALRAMAGDALEIAADYKEIGLAAHCSESSILFAMRELKATHSVQQIKGFRVKTRYILTSAEPYGSVRNLTEPYSSAPAVSAVNNTAAAVVASPDFERLKGLMKEFGIGEPAQSELARALAPKGDTDADLRRIYAITRDEYQSGKVYSLVGMTITRLRDYVAGVPLTPVKAGAAVPTEPANRPRASTRSRPRPGRQDNGYRRAPLTYSRLHNQPDPIP